MKYLMLACPMLRDEIEKYASEEGCGFPISFLPSELHRSPDNFREYVQKLLDDMTDVENLLLPMGRCGNATIGLCSPHARLILPRVSDCIDILLSDGTYPIARPERSFFLTKGWLREDCRDTIVNEYAYTVKKYGAKRTEKLMRILYSGYRNFSFVDTGAYEPETEMEKVRELAELVSISMQVIPGPCDYLRKMLRLELDDGFVVIEPGEMVSEEHFTLR